MIHYSVLKLLAGLAIAALIAWTLIVIKARLIAARLELPTRSSVLLKVKLVGKLSTAPNLVLLLAFLKEVSPAAVCFVLYCCRLLPIFKTRTDLSVYWMVKLLYKLFVSLML